MKFNLTNDQKTLAKWLVKNVRIGNIEETIRIVWENTDDEKLEGNIKIKSGPLRNRPKITTGNLDILETENMIYSEKHIKPGSPMRVEGTGLGAGRILDGGRSPTEEYRDITLRQLIYNAVDSDFGETITDKNVLISYRRVDSQWFAGRLYDRLRDQFGHGVVLMDVDDLKIGEDFPDKLEEILTNSVGVICVIGPEWLTISFENGKRRLDDEKDYVRWEIREAINRKVPIIPVLFDNVAMPREVDLPEDIKDLSSRNAIEVRHSSFGRDFDKVVTRLIALLGD